MRETTSTREQALVGLRQAGLIAVLRGDFPLQEIIEIGDALLAAPVPALEIDLASRYGLEAVAELRQRAGPHMLIGAAGVDSPEQAQTALAAGAQFTASAGFNPALVAASQTGCWLHVPGVTSPGEARQAGCRLVKLYLPAGTGLVWVQELRADLAGIDIILAGQLDLTQIQAYARTGAVAVAIGEGLIAEPYLSMAPIISTARALQAAWNKARAS